MMGEVMKGIVGTQFRNTATIGGSLYQRFGFSDPLTAFLALDTTVELYHAGEIPMARFVTMDYDRDILVRIRVKKNGGQAAYQSFRNTKTDFPVLTQPYPERMEDGRSLSAPDRDGQPWLKGRKPWRQSLRKKKLEPLRRRLQKPSFSEAICGRAKPTGRFWRKC